MRNREEAELGVLQPQLGTDAQTLTPSQLGGVADRLGGLACLIAALADLYSQTISSPRGE